MSEHTIWVPHRPKAKQRPRSTKTGVMYTPKETRDAEKIIHDLWDGPTLDEPVELEVIYYRNGQAVTVKPTMRQRISGLRGDLDNYLKLTSDALNKRAFTDDRLVVSVSAAFAQEDLTILGGV